MRKNTYISVFVVGAMFLIGGMMGWIGGSYITPVEREGQTASSGFIPGIGGGPNEGREVSPYTTTMSDFRLQLNSLLKEHGIVTSEYLKNIYDGKDTAAAKTQLDQNTDLLANMVGEMYGNQARVEFRNLWNLHITHYENYTRALKDNNENEMNSIRDALLTHAEDLGESMQKIDKNFSQARIADLTREHIRLTLDVIDAYAQPDSGLLASSTKRAYDQAGEFADYLGQAIAASRPEALQ